MYENNTIRLRKENGYTLLEVFYVLYMNKFSTHYTRIGVVLFEGGILYLKDVHYKP